MKPKYKKLELLFKVLTILFFPLFITSVGLELINYFFDTGISELFIYSIGAIAAFILFILYVLLAFFKSKKIYF